MSLAMRTWRASFLSLTDETMVSPPRPSVVKLINQFIFSQSDSLIAAAPELPPHEVTSDVMLLIKLAGDISQSEGIEELALYFVKLAHLIHGVCHCAVLQMNATYWALLLDSFRRILQILHCKPKTRSSFVENGYVIEATKQYLEITRRLFGVYKSVSLLSEIEQLLIFLIQVVGGFQWELIYSSCVNDNLKVPSYNHTSEVLSLAFIMIGEVYSNVGPSLQVDIWQSTIEVLRKVMDHLASKNLLPEHNFVARFYMELLHCLHLVLKEPRGYLAGHVAAFVATLRIFFRYGLENKTHAVNQAASQKKEVGSTGKNPRFAASIGSRSGPYRPPHLRKKVLENVVHKDEESMFSPGHDSCSSYPSSSDSDCSDSDGSTSTECSSAHFAKTRVAAIVCIQDLCRADPKLFTAQWATILPSGSVLQPRKYETTLMSCLLFDPCLKVRMAAGSTITTMLDGPASVFLQVAEFRASSKCGSFTALSSSLGQILMQLHLGTLYLIKHERHSGLLLLAFKILMLLISCTPYSRMPEELLSMVISSVQSRINEEFPFQSDFSTLLAAAVNCLDIALSVFPSMHVNDMLLEEVTKGFVEGQKNSGVLSTLCRYSEQLSSPSTSLEAFQALKTLAHNYPNIMGLCWDRISSIVHGVFRFFPEVPLRSLRGNVEHNVTVQERVVTAAVKVLDECLRAISGFKGTEDLSNDRFSDSSFTSDCIKTKAISSAPSYSLNSPSSTENKSEKCLLASERWIEAIVKHFPVIIKHSSAMVRAAAVTCFAGMTSSVFFSLPEEKQEYIISCTINAALVDEVHSVRSAACRSIGVISCFPESYVASPGVLPKFVDAVIYNARDSLVSVRITASWALGNICDSLGHRMNTRHSVGCSIDSRDSPQFIQVLVNTALQLTNDNDKVKANAVRALGNLSRFVNFSTQSSLCGASDHFMHFNLDCKGMKLSKDDDRKKLDSSMLTSSGNSDCLGKIVQTFLSCVTTGNVKVQWNVCHALSNLFSNRSLRLQDMEWASSVFSILLLLLRDSSNFKIRIQAAAALAVPENTNDYGQSYYDVFKGVEHVIENFKSYQVSDPSNFKYRIALEKQLTSTMLHLVGLAAACDQQALQDFLIKKASFIEVWIKDVCSSVGDAINSLDEVKHVIHMNHRKDVILKALHSLIEVYERSNHNPITQRFHRVADSLL